MNEIPGGVKLSRRGFKLLVGTAVLGLFVAIGGACSDDKLTASGVGALDPGGTWGAEISLNVIGRGRVLGAPAGIDCPTDCLAKYVFDSNTAEGAAGGVKLTAIPTEGSTFLGWKFDPAPVGGRGRGPDNCNPVQRAGATPAAAGNEITLPFGEVTGTSPAGQEAACGAFTRIPLAYRVTAEFSTPPDAGGPSDGVFESPGGATSTGPIGISGTSLYWVYRSAGSDGIALGASPTSTQPPAAISVVAPTSTITVFEADANGVAYQSSSGVVGFIRSGNTSARLMTGGPVSCVALAVDPLENVYCRTTTAIGRWQASDLYATYRPLYSGVSSGLDLVATSLSLYYSTTTGIQELSPNGIDGGVAAPVTVISSSGSKEGLEVVGDTAWWIGLSYLSSASISLGVPSESAYVGLGGASKIARDPSSTAFFAVNSSTSIVRVLPNSTSTTPVVTGTAIASITADSQYIYYTSTSDSRIRRAAY